MEMIKEMELMGLSDSDFETEDDESGGEDDSEEDGDEGEDDEEVLTTFISSPFRLSLCEEPVCHPLACFTSNCVLDFRNGLLF